MRAGSPLLQGRARCARLASVVKPRVAGMSTPTTPISPCIATKATSRARCATIRSASIASCASVFDVAQRAASLTGPEADALRRLYSFTVGTARCTVGAELGAKYKMALDNQQEVVSVTNVLTQEQTWFNAVRTRKPQTFKVDAGAGIVDPTDGGKRCDFCNWRMLTAEDAWGRLERPCAVTGSNLFKYGEPAHGLVLFKHHDPLAFDLEQLGDFLAVSALWFAAAAATHPAARYGFFVWNCGARAGASQFHGHGQLMLTNAPVPAQVRLQQAERLHAALCPGPGGDGAAGQQPGHTAGGAAADGTPRPCYYRDLVTAHAAVGLARMVEGPQGDRVWLLAHLAPIKDMEVMLLAERGNAGSNSHSNSSSSDITGNGGTTHAGSAGGSSSSDLASPALCFALHAALRTLIDRLGAQTFNCGMLNVPLDTAAAAAPDSAPATARAAVGAGSATSVSGTSEASAYHGTWRVVSDTDELVAALPRVSNGGGHDATNDGNGGAAAAVGPSGSPWRPLLARVVSRGRVTSPASDFGCLEVVGGASIGHTDPYVLVRALDEQLGEQLAAVAAVAGAEGGGQRG